ncbi:hypothetical protein [Algibacter lectus]|uniref:Cthe-2314-like HEPN domain-containing protein n=1 Tax=Algibacter lectus TaxID=221126 RepID=A0A4V3HGQ8_9FLAO|nr:hypothetical protein [Algibacter lectus]MWW24282.1 hypothetical protein [Algibacter lectus]TDY62301.1 hypothetical protein DFQ06_2128 [Algibacter lectus]
MKHIVPKTIKIFKTSFDFKDIKEEDIPEESKEVAKDVLKSKNYDDNYDIMVQTSNNKATFGFDYLYKQEKKFIPELDPSVIYFSSAQLFSGMIYNYKKELLKNSFSLKDITKNKSNQSLDDTIKQFEIFFQFASSYVIMLSASLEAFVNKLIPIDYIYTTKEGIEKDIEWIHRQSIDFKTKKIIPNCTEKDYTIEYESKYEEILAIKNFRNDLIHLTPKNEITNTKYKDFYRKVIDFKYSEAIYSIKHYINYHEEGLIEECACGNDFYFDLIKK